MSDFPDQPEFWLLGVLNENLLPLNEVPFSFQIRVPITSVERAPKVKDFVFVAQLSNELARINSMLHINHVEIESEYLTLVGDPRQSVVFGKQTALPEVKVLLPERPDEIRLVCLDGDVVNKIEISVRAKWRTTFGEVPSAIREVAIAYSPKSVSSESELVESINVGLRRSFAEDDMVVTGAISKGLTPHSAVAANLARWLVAREIVEIRGAGSFWVQTVDLDLREVSDLDLKARTFTPAVIDGSGLAEAAAKLDRAEARHQFILADCVNRLNKVGITPLLSNSVDLAIKRGAKLRLFEIKSATPENFNSQFEKGLIQASRYKWEFESKFNPVLASLIIESPSQNMDIADEYFEFAEYTNIGLLIWDEAKEWPERVSNFDPWA
ncbi:unannotated protein [freshwater metagenome]|uniref:Unannotated protein n=1 Tax=freshwater metagenome TaxID=449393 RepID=A0A6J6IQV7_9ZZZZ|nr:hypothetical protein [Actinomycetota bacterium]